MQVFNGNLVLNKKPYICVMISDYIKTLAQSSYLLVYPEDDEVLSQFRELYGYFKELEGKRLEYVESVLYTGEWARQSHIVELQRVRATIVEKGFVGRKDLQKLYPEIKDMPWFCFRVTTSQYELTKKQIEALRPDGWMYLIDYGLCLSVDKAIQTIKGVSESEAGENRPSVDNSPTVEDNKKCEIVSGTKGLADFLGCSKSMAFSIIDSGVLKTEKIQYKVGRCWKFHRKRLEEYLAEHPEILSRVRCKR